MTTLPNYHQGAHFDLAQQEYATPWNCNGLWGEDKHREYKDHVQYTNHITPERDIMRKDGILSSLRFLYQGVFKELCPEVTAQVKELQRKCPLLLDPVLSVEDIYRSTGAPETSHRHIVLRRRQTQRDCSLLGIPSSYRAAPDSFKDLFRSALSSCRIRDTIIKDSQISWYLHCSFAVPYSTRRRFIYTGKFAYFSGNKVGKVRGVISYSDLSKQIIQIFVWVQEMAGSGEGEIDLVLSMPILRLTDRFFVVPIQAIDEGFAYLIPCSSAEDNDSFIHCTWSVKFL